MALAAPRQRRIAIGTTVAVALSALAIADTSAADTVSVELVARKATVRVAPGVKMRAWTFNGSVPAPVLRVREGDTIEVTLRNADRAMAHSIDFHAAEVDPQQAFADVAPGKSRTFSFVARRPGVFMYHCGTSPVMQHIGMGMYGAIVVDPAAGRLPARETVLVRSELYGRVRDGMLHSSYAAMRRSAPVFTAFNGRAFRYRDRPIEVAAGELQRIFVVDAGPTLDTDFHVVGEVFDIAQADGNPANTLHGVSTLGVPAGGGAMLELIFDQPGRYPFVDHAFRWADIGSLGFFEAH